MKTEMDVFATDEDRMVRRASRRQFFRAAGSVAALAAAGPALLTACSGGSSEPTPTPSPTPTPGPTPSPTPTPGVPDPDFTNYLLSIQYLLAQFFSRAVLGEDLPAGSKTGSGTQGEVIGGRQVTFTDQVLGEFAREIAVEQRAQLEFMRTEAASYAVAQPRINISAGDNGAFTQAARAAGVVAEGANFDPYASEDNFLLAAFFLLDIAVTAYRGAARLVDSGALEENFTRLAAADAHHSAMVRVSLYERGQLRPELIQNADRFSDLRDQLDGPEDKDQGVARENGQPNIVPTNANGIVFGRTPGEVLNILFLTAAPVKQGGFFPNGVNGVVNTSDDND